MKLGEGPIAPAGLVFAACDRASPMYSECITGLIFTAALGHCCSLVQTSPTCKGHEHFPRHPSLAGSSSCSLHQHRRCILKRREERKLGRQMFFDFVILNPGGWRGLKAGRDGYHIPNEKGVGESKDFPEITQPRHMAQPGFEPGLSESRAPSSGRPRAAFQKEDLWVQGHAFLCQLQECGVSEGLFTLKHGNSRG